MCRYRSEHRWSRLSLVVALAFATIAISARSVSADEPVSVLEFPKDEAQEQVGELAFSPNGRYLASAGPFTLRMWDLDTGESTLLFGSGRGGEGWLPSGISFSPNGERLAAFVANATNQTEEWKILTWDPETRNEQENFAEHVSHKAGLTPRQLVFSPDGSLLTIDAHDPSGVMLVNAKSRNVAATLPSINAHSYAFSPDGKLLAVGSTGRKWFEIWDIQQQALLRRIEPAVVDRIAFSPDGKQLVTCMPHLGLGLWDVKTGKPVRPHVTAAKNWPKVRPGQVRRHVSAAISSDAKIVAVPDYYRHTIRLFDVERGVRLATIRTHQHPISLVFSEDIKTLAVGTITESRNLSEVSGIELWDIPAVVASSAPHAHSRESLEGNRAENP